MIMNTCPPKHWFVVCGYRFHKSLLGLLIVLLGVVLTGIIPESIIGVCMLIIGALVIFSDVLGHRLGPNKKWRLIFVEKIDDPIDFINEEFDLQV